MTGPQIGWFLADIVGRLVIGLVVILGGAAVALATVVFVLSAEYALPTWRESLLVGLTLVVLATGLIVLRRSRAGTAVADLLRPIGCRPSSVGPMESVWDYPRPPRLERTTWRITVVHAGVTVADSDQCWRVLETSHPPVYYFPLASVAPGVLVAASRQTYCEFKGDASYWDLLAGPEPVRDAAWSYESPAEGYAALKGAVAFYPGRVDACVVDGEQVRVQPGDFYGGWITSDIEGPFKGSPGTSGW